MHNTELEEAKVGENGPNFEKTLYGVIAIFWGVLLPIPHPYSVIDKEENKWVFNSVVNTSTINKFFIYIVINLVKLEREVAVAVWRAHYQMSWSPKTSNRVLYFLARKQFTERKKKSLENDLSMPIFMTLGEKK